MLRIAAFVAAASLAGATWTPPTYNHTVAWAFGNKTLLNPLPNMTGNPYNNASLNLTWPDSVCAVHYPNEPDRSVYDLYTYPSKEAAVAAGSFVTHLHPCGYCSTTKDLSVYMLNADLTNPVRDCALESFISDEAAIECLHKIGFTYECSTIWYYDAMNSRKECLDVCLEAWVEGTPNNIPANSTNLSPCIACDEYKSGPVFKVVAGRTRRDSGLKSSINRPPNQIYHVVHNYY